MANFLLIRHGFLLCIVFAFVSSIALVIHALTNDVNVKSGIVTIQFNSSEFALDIANGIFSKRGLLSLNPEDILKDLPSEIEDIIPDADQIQGTLDGISETFGNVENTVKALLPKNCSIGTRKFCIGFPANQSCHNLPIKLASIFPPEGEKLLRGIDGALAKVTDPYIQNALIAGSASTLIFDAFLIYSLYNLHIPLIGGLGWSLQLSIYLIVGLIFYAPFVIPIVFIYVLRSTIDALPRWMQLQEGNVFGLCIGCLCCSAIAVVVGSIGRILSFTTATSSKSPV